MSTQKLYEQDVLSRSFSATVLSCEASRDGWLVLLDRTGFFPEGGGQMCDTGTLGGAQVLAVHDRGGEILHTLDAPLAAGAAVQGEIDWARRLDQMQQHSGEHIVSGLIHARFGYDNVGFHIGASETTLDFNGTFTAQALEEIEREANAAVWNNLPVSATYPGAQALQTLVYRQKKPLEGDIRIVDIPGCDTCACCGTHVPYTGMIGLIKIVDAAHYKGGMRLTLLCGARALNDYAHKHRLARTLGATLCVKPEQTPEAVKRLTDARDALAAQLDTAALALFQAQSEAGESFVFVPVMRAPQAKKCAFSLLAHAPLGGVFAGNALEGWSFVLCAQKGAADAGAACRALCAALNGRGGGGQEMAQGTLPPVRQDEITSLLAAQN